MATQTSAASPTERRVRRALERYERALDQAERSRAELDRAVFEMVKSGRQQTEVARILGVTKARVNHIVKAHNEALAQLGTAEGVTTHGASHEQQHKS